MDNKLDIYFENLEKIEFEDFDMVKIPDNLMVSVEAVIIQFNAIINLLLSHTGHP